MGTDPDIDKLRRLEQVCLEQAEQCATPEARAALLLRVMDVEEDTGCARLVIMPCRIKL